MFEQLPFLHGDYLTYREYFCLLFAATPTIVAVTLLLLRAAVLHFNRAHARNCGCRGLQPIRRGGAIGSNNDISGEKADRLVVPAAGSDAELQLSPLDASSYPPADEDDDGPVTDDTGGGGGKFSRAVIAVGLLTVWLLWFVWSLMAFGSTSWSGWICALVAVVALLGGWPVLAEAGRHLLVKLLDRAVVGRQVQSGPLGWTCAYRSAAGYYAALPPALCWAAAFAGSYALLQPSVWGFLPAPLGAILGALPLLPAALGQPWSTDHASGGGGGGGGHKGRRCFSRLGLGSGRRRLYAAAAACLAWAGFWAGALDGMCIAYFQDFEHGLHLGPVLVSTRLSRSWYTPACQPGARGVNRPCHLYLSAAEDMSRSVFVNAHLAVGAPELQVCYNIVAAVRVAGGEEEGRGDVVVQGDAGAESGRPEAQRSMCVAMASYAGLGRDVEDAGQRTVRTALLTELEPDTVYSFSLQQAGDGTRWSDNKRFRTVPTSSGFTFAVGGDSGSTVGSRQMMTAIAARSPAFVVHGGDIAVSATASIASTARLSSSPVADE
jgi:hypothetical protein